MAFSFSVSQIEKNTEYQLSGNLLDKESADKLLVSFEENLIKGTCYFIFNMKDMDYLNSTGLNVLIGLLTKVRNSGGELIICNVPKKINQLLLITKLNTVFNVVMTTDEAKSILEKERNSNVSENK
ncbi:MAG: STAS domain-containing protein [Flavobacteriales bacterium]|nr:STAS domain-containing protein [Flavobacteriales bacterium]